MPPVEQPSVVNSRPRIPQIFGGQGSYGTNAVQQALSNNTPLTSTEAILKQMSNRPSGADASGVREVNKLKPAELPTDLFDSARSKEDPFTSFFRQLNGIGDRISERRAAGDAAYDWQQTVAKLRQQAEDQNRINSNMGSFGGMDLSGISATGKRASLIQNVNKYIGLPYSWGGGGSKGPSYGIGRGSNTYGFDCSGLVQFAFASVGLKIPRFSGSQLNWAKARGYITSINKLQAGDLVGRYGGSGGGHVAIYLGGGRILEAPYTGARVRIRKITSGSGYVGIHVRY